MLIEKIKIIQKTFFLQNKKATNTQIKKFCAFVAKIIYLNFEFNLSLFVLQLFDY